MEQTRRCFLPLLSIALSLFLVQGVLFAQETGKIRGVVTDAETGEPLPEANVIIEGTSLGSFNRCGRRLQHPERFAG